MLFMFFAPGFEEVEAIATLDVIRRANIEIEAVGINSKSVTGSHGITVVTDKTADEISFEKLEGVILPGGMPGTTNLMADEKVNSAIDFCTENNKLICAICAAPMILGRKGILEGKNATCFPGFEEELSGANATGEFVVADGNVITGKGMGSAVNFGLEIVKHIKGSDFAENLRSTLQCS